MGPDRAGIGREDRLSERFNMTPPDPFGIAPIGIVPNALDPIPDSRGINLFQADPSFQSLLSLYLDAPLLAHLLPYLERLGTMAGDELDTLAATADRNPPVLHQRNRAGQSVQHIEKHPASRRLDEIAFIDFELASISHRPGALGWAGQMPPVAKYALSYLFAQAEFGTCCPVSMTDSLIATIRKFADPALLARYIDGLTAVNIDALLQGAMFMTERHAGSDVGAITTQAVQAFDAGTVGNATAWRLFGEKWFCSNPDADLALVLARPSRAEQAGTKGLGLFLLPRKLPDGTANRYRIIRLKDKLGSRSIASGEIVLDGAIAWLVGSLGAGFAQMTEMINLSRLSNGMRAAAMMRRALTEARFIAERRIAFGKPLIERPLVQRQLLKMMVPTEAARSVMLVTARAMAQATAGDEAAARHVRLLTPLIKFRACGDARTVTGDAMEMRGGCGYIEEWSDARLVRDSHLGSIWEGTSNVVALDVMRAMRDRRTADALVPFLDGMIDAVAVSALHQPLRNAVTRAVAFATTVAETKDHVASRQAASGLYYAVAAVVQANEGSQFAATGDARRLLLAALTLSHHLVARDPLALGDSAFEEACFTHLLDERAISLDDVSPFIAKANF
jgi:acyl-CoA dehydrogenase